MARMAFEKILAGLEDALAYADGDSSRGIAQQVKVADVDSTHLREKLGTVPGQVCGPVCGVTR